MNLKISTKKSFWLLLCLVGIIFVLFAMAPQFSLWKERGGNWNGAYALQDFDEPAYAAYLQSIIDGKPRKNSPYSGAVDSPKNNLNESLFSIQFLAFYPTAVIAKLLGISASGAMILQTILVGFFSATILFWLFYLFCEDLFISFAGATAVLTCGGLIAGSGYLNQIFNPDSVYYYFTFPFLRRSVPAVGFPFLFLFFGLIWQILTAGSNKKKILFILFSLCSFGFLLYTYFFLWTTALAWLGGLLILFVVFDFKLLKKNFIYLIIFASALALLFLPYVLLILNRSASMDSIQALNSSHAPDFLRSSIILSLITLGGYIITKKTGWLKINNTRFIFLISFTLVAPIVFNQQIITGFSLQPVHYNFFTANYVSLFALFILIGLILKKNLETVTLQKSFLLISLLFIYFGYLNAQKNVEILRDINVLRDNFVPVAKKIKYNAQEKIHFQTNPSHEYVLSFDFNTYTYMNSDEIPTFASKPVLWAPHQSVFSDLTKSESLERLFFSLYFQNFDSNSLRKNLNTNEQLRIEFFGWHRTQKYLGNDNKQITQVETEQAIRTFGEFIKSFDSVIVKKYPISFVVAPKSQKVDLKTLKLWYNIQSEEIVGDYVLYRLKFIPQIPDEKMN